MNPYSVIVKSNEKRMTLQEIAAATGAAYRTVADYAQRAGWTQNGVQTLLDEKQVAIIVEAMKVAQPNQHSDTLQGSLQGIETTQSRAIRIAVLAERRIEIERQFAAELEAELAEEREKNELLTRQNEALEVKAREAAPKLDHYDQCMAISRTPDIFALFRFHIQIGRGEQKVSPKRLEDAQPSRAFPARKQFKRPITIQLQLFP